MHYAAQGICEVQWIDRIFNELKVKMSNWLPVKAHCANEAQISIFYNPAQHDKTKHVEADKHFIKGQLQNGFLTRNTSMG